MFRGTSSHKMDPRGRITIPARFIDMVRKSHRDCVILTETSDADAISVYEYGGWDQLMAKYRHENKDRRQFRCVAGTAAECPMDGHGCITIPRMFREYAALKDEIIIIGVLDHFEIWSKQNWESESKRLQALNLNEIRYSFTG